MSPSPRLWAALIWALPATLTAQTALPEAMPAPGVLEVRTLGSWTGADGDGGDIRLVTRDAGLETPRITQTVVWSLRDFDARSFENVASAVLTGCDAAALGQVQVLSATQPDLDGPVYLLLQAYGDPNAPPLAPLYYEIGDIGEIGLRAGCS